MEEFKCNYIYNSSSSPVRKDAVTPIPVSPYNKIYLSAINHNSIRMKNIVFSDVASCITADIYRYSRATCCSTLCS